MSLRIDYQLQHLLPLLDRLGTGLRQLDIDLGLALEGGRHHEEQQQNKNHIDERREIDIRLVAAAASQVQIWSSITPPSLERSPCSTSTMRSACCSMRMTSIATLPRK